MMFTRKYISFILLILISACKKKEESEKIMKEDWILWSSNWNSNDTKIAVGGNQDTLRIFSTDNLEIDKNYPYKGTITNTRWHPTKNLLAISVQDGKSKSTILNFDNEESIELDSITTDGARAIGWNHSGDFLALGDYDGNLIIFDEKGNFLKKINTNQRSIIGLDWHPDKNIISAVGERISIYDFDNDTIYDIKPRKEDVLMLCVAWHPNGQFFVTGDYGDFENYYPPLLQFWTSDGKKIRDIKKSKAEFRNISWSNDGKILATASESLRLWNENGVLLKESESGNLLWGIDWNKSDSKIITTDEKGKIIIWDKELNQIQELKY